MKKFFLLLFVLIVTGCKVGGNIIIKQPGPHDQRPDITVAITVEEAYEQYSNGKRN